ncbi:MAG: heme exporter protein CcmD [Pseudomonadota bacterium]
MHEFLHMGGYAFYVWTSYALAALVLALNWALPRRALRRLRRAAARTSA